MSTSEEALELLRYPIGKFVRGTTARTPERVAECTERIAALPATLRATVHGLNDAQLDTPYRLGGWTVRQVVNHFCDSHMNGLARFKWALTEDAPVIKAYREAQWADLADARTMPLEASFQLISGLHERWVFLVKSLSVTDLDRSFFHPDQDRSITLGEALETYAWHCRHHVAHIERLREREGW